MNDQWFESWFNTKYYHILYKNRNDEEAQRFIDNALRQINLHAGAKILDIACGKGRHSKYLNSKGFDVTGIDLSSESIAEASASENEGLHFFEHDMRKIFRLNYFDLAVNMFTSFGYFDNHNDNYETIHAMASTIKNGGYLLIDFFNSQFVENTLVPKFETVIDGVTFATEKKIENDFVVKNITVFDNQNEFHYQEKVQLLTLENFKNYLAKEKLVIQSVLGNYELDEFNLNESPRLIILAQKLNH
jgi:SAM-dependent methyltransferase